MKLLLSNLENFINGRIEALHALRESVTDEQIENVASILTKANVGNVAAQHRSFHIVAYLTYAFSRLSVPNTLLAAWVVCLQNEAKQSRKEMLYWP